MRTACDGARRNARRRKGDGLAGPPGYHLLPPAPGAAPEDRVRGARLDVVGLSTEVLGPAGPVTLLHDISLSIYRGEFVALVGSSGAGKSTLLSTLAGLQRAGRGRILLDGAAYEARVRADRSLVGYLPQDDIVHGPLPVSTALGYAAALRLSDRAAPGTTAARVGGALASVALEAQGDQRVDSLSGGQRKRANLAQELVAQPSLLLLDEPTTGSDPALDQRLMRTLRQRANAGCSVILATHATAHLNQCDLVAVLARGRLVFVGPPDDAPDYFGVPDFRAVYDVLDGGDEDGAEGAACAWERRFRNSWYYDLYIAQRLRRSQTAALGVPPAPTGEASSWGWVAAGLRQWWTLTQRAFELTCRDRATAGVRLAVLAFVGAMLALLTHPRDLVGLDAAEWTTRPAYNAAAEAQNVLFVLALAAVLLGLVTGVHEILHERAIYRRERLAGLGVLPYILAKLTLLAFLSVTGSLLLFLMMWLHLLIPATALALPAAAELYVTLLLTTLAGAALGLALSTVARSDAMAAYLLKFAVFSQIVFAGLLFELPAAAKPLAWLTITKPALDALGSTVDVPALAATARVQGQPGHVAPLRISYAHDVAHILDLWAVLGGLIVGFAVLAYACLWAQDPGSPPARIGELLHRLRQRLNQRLAHSLQTTAQATRALSSLAVERAWPAALRWGAAAGRFVVGEDAAPPGHELSGNYRIQHHGRIGVGDASTSTTTSGYGRASRYKRLSRRGVRRRAHVDRIDT